MERSSATLTNFSAASPAAAPPQTNIGSLTRGALSDGPFRDTGSELQHDLADEQVGGHVRKRRLVVLERKHPVDHRMQVVLSAERAHAQVVGTRADEDTLRAGRLEQKPGRRNVAVVTRQPPDDGERPPIGETLDRLDRRRLPVAWRPALCDGMCGGLNMATNPSIDPKLIDSALKLSGEKTKRAAVTRALEEFIARRRQKRVLDLLGQLEWDKDFDYKAERTRR